MTGVAQASLRGPQGHSKHFPARTAKEIPPPKLAKTTFVANAVVKQCGVIHLGTFKLMSFGLQGNKNDIENGQLYGHPVLCFLEADRSSVAS